MKKKVEELKNKIQEVANSTQFKIKVVEKGGKTIKSMLQKSDVIPNKKCWDEDCPICLTEAKGNAIKKMLAIPSNVRHV